MVERTKRECAWKSPQARKRDTRRGEREREIKYFSLSPPCVARSEFQKHSLSKWGQVHNLSCENEFYLEWKIISIWKTEHLTSFWYRGPVELRNAYLISAWPCVISHLLYEICVKIFIMNRYILKSYTTTKNHYWLTIYRARAAAVSTTGRINIGRWNERSALHLMCDAE